MPKLWFFQDCAMQKATGYLWILQMNIKIIYSLKSEHATSLIILSYLQII